MSAPGALLASTVTGIAALGFVPIAVHFKLFPIINRIGPVATVEALTAASDQERSAEEKTKSPLCLQLTADTMYAMAGLGLVDMVDDRTFRTNPVTEHMVTVPSSLHGILHFTTEPLWSAAFFMKQLQDSNFKYPFESNKTPFQYGYKLIGERELENEHLYSIMHLQGRAPSFDAFMEGKFGKFGTMPERLKNFGYDFDSVLSGKESGVAVVDVGGGRGEMLLEVKEAYPHLTKESLVLQDYHPDEINAEKLTVTHWDFKDDSPQPISGALVYSLTHIYHNLPDLEALTLMKKLSKAMAPHSRMLIHEFPKNINYGKMHAAMIQMMGGRERSSREWKQMAAIAGLEVTFEVYPEVGEGLVEMRKLQE